MKYLHSIYLPALNLTSEEEEYLDNLLRHELWCKRNQGNFGRNISIYEAIEIFKDDIYEIALESGNQELLNIIKNKDNLEFTVKKERAKSIPIRSLITTEIKLNKTICPFHNDTNASLHIYDNTNSYYCFVCGVGGDVIDFIKRLNGCTFVEAINYLT